MLNVFISYERESKRLVGPLADDIKVLGHTVWFDQELSGGQAWWDQILAQVRSCDVFVFSMTPAALDSTACQREFGYAADLGKPILPILLLDGVSTNLLPPALSAIQFVDYRKRDDHGSALQLAKALSTTPAAKPLPSPLPTPPAVPLSYLSSLKEQIEAVSVLDQQRQMSIVVDLKRGLRNPETAGDSRALLERLRERPDLLATVADEIDELLVAPVAPALSSRVGTLQETSEVQRLSWIQRAFLLFAPSSALGWGFHLAFYFILLFGALGLLGLAIEPYDAKTGENLWAYGLLGLTLIVVLPGLMLQRVAIRIRQRNAHRRARAEHHGDLFQGQASRMA